MAQIGGVIKAFTMPMVAISDMISKESQKGGATDSTKVAAGAGVGAAAVGTAITLDAIISMVASIVFMALAGYLCWKCNEKEDTFLRAIYTLLAVIFNTFYLVYYFIYRVVMGKAC